MKYRSGFKIMAVSLALSVLVGCSHIGGQGKIAVVNGQDIPKSDYDKAYNNAVSAMHIKPEMLQGPQGKMMVGFIQRSIVSQLIVNALIDQEAKKRHITASDAEVNAMYDKLTSTPESKKVIEDHIKSGAIQKNELMEDIRKEVLREKLADALGGKDVHVTEADAKDYFEHNPQAFNQPEQVDARHILIMANKTQIYQQVSTQKKNASPSEIQQEVAKQVAAKKAQAQTIYNQVKANPASFADVARAKSEDKASAVNGGDLGFFARGAMVPAFSTAAFNTKPGQIYDGIVESPYGYHIIEVVDRRPAEKKTFAQVEPQLIVALARQKKLKVLENWVTQQRDSAKIKIEPAYDFDKQQQQQSAGGPLAPGAVATNSPLPPPAHP